MFRSVFSLSLAARAFSAPLLYINSQLPSPSTPPNAAPIMRRRWVEGDVEDKIYTYHFDTESGKSTLLDSVDAGVNPSWIQFEKENSLLIATNELEEFEGEPTGAVQSFSVSKDGKLSFISRVKSAGTLPCHVNADRNARTVLVANYGSGTVASIALDEEGKLWPPPPSHVVQHRGNDTQTPHAHHVPFSGATGRNVLAVDLGLDRVYQYTLGAQNELLPHSSMPFISLPDGAGPRHVKPHPHLSVAYVLNELGSSIATFHYDRASGYLGTQLELLPTLAPGQNTTGNFPAEVVVHPNGRHVYSSNRGDESIVQFDIDQSTGRLTFVRTTPTGGSWPRHFTLDPTGTRMLVANQRGNNIVTFQVDPNTGHVTRMNVPEISIPGPACVQFLEL